MSNKATITLEGKEYEIRVPFTIGQIKRLNIIIATGPENGDPKAQAEASFDRSTDIIFEALHADNPEITREQIEAMRPLKGEFRDAWRKILIESFLIDPEKETKPGEAGAGAA